MAKTTIVWSGNQSSIVYDALNDYVIHFTYNGNQVIQNRIVVRNNEDNDVVYDHTITSMRLEHIIPAATLENGMIYNATIQAFYRAPDGSPIADLPSKQELIRCLRTPSITFSNITDGEVVRNSNVDVIAVYDQEQSDLANRYTFRLYDNGHKEIWQTIGYVASSTVPISITANISGLFNNQQYFISCEVESVGGMVGTTGYIGISILYQKPRSYSTMYLSNVPEQGSVKITSNIKAIDAIIIGDDPVYINDEMIDLTSGGTTVSWEEMGLIDTDFEIILKIVSADEMGKSVLQLESNNRSLLVKIIRGVPFGETVDKLYAILNASVGGVTYTTASNFIDAPQAGSTYYVFLVRHGDFYSLTIREEAGP